MNHRDYEPDKHQHKMEEEEYNYWESIYEEAYAIANHLQYPNSNRSASCMAVYNRVKELVSGTEQFYSDGTLINYTCDNGAILRVILPSYPSPSQPAF